MKCVDIRLFILNNLYLIHLLAACTIYTPEGGGRLKNMVILIHNMFAILIK